MLVPSSVLNRQKKRPRPADRPTTSTSNPPTTKPTNTNSTPQPHHDNDAPPPKRSRFTTAEVTPTYLETLVSGIELILSDHAYQTPESLSWITQHTRVVDGKDYIHLAPLTTHPHLTPLKPPPTQPLLARALTTFPSPLLALPLLPAHNLIQRLSPPPPSNPSPPPPPPPPSSSSAPPRSRTVYIEPHLSTLAAHPARLAQHIRTHPGLPASWLPVQDVRCAAGRGRAGYAFVLLSGGGWGGEWRSGEGWREKEVWPAGWIVLPVGEWEGRVEEYKRLREGDKEKRRGGGRGVQSEAVENKIVAKREKAWVGKKVVFGEYGEEKMEDAGDGQADTEQGATMHENAREIPDGVDETRQGRVDRDDKERGEQADTVADGTKNITQTGDGTTEVSAQKRRKQLAKKRMKEKKKKKRNGNAGDAVAEAE